MAKSSNNGPKAALGLAALAAAAGAYYFYGGKHGAQHRRKMKAWILKAQGEMLGRLEQLKDVSQEAYEAAIAQMVDKYKKFKDVPPEELAALAAEMRGHWKRISAQIGGGKKPARKAARKKS